MTVHDPLCRWANTPTHRDRADCPECARIRASGQERVTNRYLYAQTGRALPMCGDCGAIVGDTAVHDRHHDRVDSMTALSVTTAHNLMSTLNALIGEVPDEAV
jgi:hypothetical protein